jgi:uncharacterized lipoprotein YbaY
MKILACALALLAFGACRRPDPGADARVEVELAGAWVREIRDRAAEREGFDLRADGSVGLVGIFTLNGVAWNYARGELVLSTNTDRHASTTPVRLQIESFEDGVLVLGPAESDYFAGSWRRSDVQRLAGVVTYLEPVTLPHDARVDVRLMRDDALVARTLVTPRGPVPIPFALSHLPGSAADAGALTLAATIFTPEAALFATTAFVEAPPRDEDPIEIIVRAVAK